MLLLAVVSINIKELVPFVAIIIIHYTSLLQTLLSSSILLSSLFTGCSGSEQMYLMQSFAKEDLIP